MSERHKAYWRKTLTMTGMLLVVWMALTFASAMYPRELRGTAELLYATVIAFYAWYLHKQDRIYAGREPDKEPPWH